MPIIILISSFIAVFFSFGIWSGAKASKKETLICSVLIFSVAVVFFTETLSLLHKLNFQFILIAWTLVLLLNMIYIISRKREMVDFMMDISGKMKSAYHNLSKFEIVFSAFVVILLLLVFIQGFVYPPNNEDSLAYHLARITNWISHQSVEHYPTHTFRQIYQPPFSEYLVMHANVLNKGDYFSNAVQTVYLCFSATAIASIIRLLGLNIKYQLIGLVLCMTIPEVLLQASSVQNDIMVSFYILSAVYFAVKASKAGGLRNYLFLGISVGIAILTKGTAYIFLCPVLLVFAISILKKLFKNRQYAVLGTVISILVFAAINSGHYLRNYHLVDNLLGTDEREAEFYANQKMSTSLLFSSVVKNAGNHLGPGPISLVSNKAIVQLHEFLNINRDEPGNNIFDIKYEGASYMPFYEDNAPNPIHFILIVVSFMIIGFHMLKERKGHGMILLYLAILLLQVLLFCFYLKWQPWHSRLHTPFFMMSMPVVCYALSLSKKYIKLFNLAFLLVLMYALPVVLLNASRPFISCKYTYPISMKDERFKKYFVFWFNPEVNNGIYRHEEYKHTLKSIDHLQGVYVGLVLGDYMTDWVEETEYVLFHKIYSNRMKPVHIKVFNNPTKKIPVNPAKLAVIISTTHNQSSIEHNETTYYNHTAGHKTIWLYKDHEKE